MKIWAQLGMEMQENNERKKHHCCVFVCDVLLKASAKVFYYFGETLPLSQN